MGTRSSSKRDGTMTQTVDVMTDVYIQNRYSIGKKLDAGESSRVVEATEFSTGKRFAIKILDKSDRQNWTTFENETKILQILQHPNIMAMRESHSDSDYFYIVSELCEGGDLFDRIMDPNRCISEKWASKLIRTMLRAVKHCHENQIVHRDLKPENFVFRSKRMDSQIVLIDFGCAKIVKDNVRYRDSYGTAHYIAPEVAAGRKYTRTGRILKCSDVWSIGVIAYILMTGEVPFTGSSRTDIFNSILHLPLMFPEGGSNLSVLFKDFCKQILVKSPLHRITISDALEHPWIQGKFFSTKLLEKSELENKHQAIVGAPGVMV